MKVRRELEEEKNHKINAMKQRQPKKKNVIIVVCEWVMDEIIERKRDK